MDGWTAWIGWNGVERASEPDGDGGYRVQNTAEARLAGGILSARALTQTV